jgi:hypothetical protein
MPVLPNQLNITELDYDQILTNLVAFMKTDPAFSDYDFAGSGLRLLARVLAYVTFYQNYYVTAALNESFLDTAQLRSSVASHARMLGYTIKGTTSSRIYANVAVRVTNSSVPSITLPKKTQFTLDANGQFSFYSLADAQLTLNATSLLYQGTGVELVEGKPLQYRFTADLTNPTQRFVIPNANVDYTTVDVRVQASAASNVVTQFLAADEMLEIGADDPVFFIQEAFDGLAELKFGNGVVGRALQQNNIVIVDYFISRGEASNNLRGPFTIPTANVSGFVSGATAVDGNTVPSMGGSDIESLDSARFLAPQFYQTQNRCVTAEDYKTVILTNMGSQIGAINVFGGEQGDPSDPLNRPVFGRVFVALKPAIGLRFTDVVRQNIEQNVLKPRSIVGVIPTVIDPDYIYLNVSTSVKYDAKTTTRTKTQLDAAIKQSVLDYAESNIEKFDTSFRFSKFVRVIDDTDDAVVSSLTRIDLEKRVFPTLGVANQYVLKFNSPLRKNSDGSVIMEATAHRFTYTNDLGVVKENCFLFEQNGSISVVYRDTTGKIATLKSGIGTADANSGLITIANFAPTAIENSEIDIRVRVVPAVNDFVPRLNQLFTIDQDSGVTVQLLNDATATTADQLNFFVGGILP